MSARQHTQVQAGAAGAGDAAGVLAGYAARIEALALAQGLEFPRVDFELVPDSFMAEIAIYGLPVRMRHWSFGVRYIHQLVHQKMGNSHIFEVMFPGDPCHAYMAEHNSVAENTLVTAHVLGHADFASRNALFQHFGAMAGTHILEQSAARAQRIEAALQCHGQDRVEAVLDAALALEQHVDIHAALHRPAYPAPATAGEAADATGPSPGSGTGSFAQRYGRLPGESAALAAHRGGSGRAWRNGRCCHPGPNTICCGSSPATGRNWRTGNATSSSPCAKSRFTSIPCLPARS